MPRYLLDTSIASALFNGVGDLPARVRDISRKGHRVGLCMPVVGELFFGAEYSQSREKNYRTLLRSLKSHVIWPFDRNAAEIYGRLFAGLRRKGRPMQQVDVQIAAIAISMGCTVVSTDSDFLAIPDLKVEDWTKPSS